MTDLFVSWSGDHARNIGENIRSLFDKFEQTFKVFLSSRDIQTAMIWQENLLINLHNADDGIVIFSQESIKSDWLLHESAVLSSRTKALTIFLLGAPAELLPQPLRRFQHARLSRESLEFWLDRIISSRRLIISPAQRDAFLRKIADIIADYEATHVASTEHKWSGAISRPIAISKQNESPFEVQEILRVARSRIILIAQNHGFMTDPNGPKDLIEELIFERLATGVTVDIIAMHPRVSPAGTPSPPDACNLWAHYMGAPSFHAHLERCWEMLFSWNRRYHNTAVKGKLRIKGAYFLPVSINIVDPDKPDGFLVLSPRMAQEASAPRPQFIATKQHERGIFNFYWETVRSSFDNSGWIDIERLPTRL